MTYITPHEKQRIFALYHGQEIALFRGHLYNIVGLHNESDVLHVKDVAKITDEDAILVSKICKDRYGGEMDSSVSNIKQWARIYARNCSEICDFLRSHGYALPAFGYSVDELVKQNIFQIDNGKES